MPVDVRHDLVHHRSQGQLQIVGFALAQHLGQISLAYNPAASEQSYIISDPGYTNLDAQIPFKWSGTEDLPGPLWRFCFLSTVGT